MLEKVRFTIEQAMKVQNGSRIIIIFFLTEGIPLCSNNCTLYYIPSLHNNINIVI